ncbi:hypothetical protein Nmel_002377, partial [Mimus melanotis]
PFDLSGSSVCLPAAPARREHGGPGHLLPQGLSGGRCRRCHQQDCGGPHRARQTLASGQQRGRERVARAAPVSALVGTGAGEDRGTEGGGGRSHRGTKGASEPAAAGGKVTWAAAGKPKPVPPCREGRGEERGPGRAEGGGRRWCHFLPPPLPAPRARQGGEGGCSSPPSWRPSRDARSGRDWAAGGAGSGRGRRARPGVTRWRPKVTRVTFAAAPAPAAGLAAPPSNPAPILLAASFVGLTRFFQTTPVSVSKGFRICRPGVFVVMCLSYICSSTSQNHLGATRK